MAKEERARGFDSLINVTSQAFDASMLDQDSGADDNAPRMINNRQSVYKVPLSMIHPDRFQARFILPLRLRQAFYSGDKKWDEVTREWLAMAQADALLQKEINELIFLGDSLHDTGQIKPVTGQVVNDKGRDVFLMLTGERRFWATALTAVKDGFSDEPVVLAIIDNQPSLEKQIAENMAYKELTAVGKARAAARIVLEANGILPDRDEEEYAYFRKITDIRLNDDARQKLQDALQLERTYYGRLMKYFDLPEELIEVCDRAEMPERVLREIMQYDRAHWERGIKFYAAHPGCSYLDVHVFMDSQIGKMKNRAVRPAKDPATKTGRSIRRALYAIEDIPQEDKFGALADAMLGDIDPDAAQQLLQSVRELESAMAIRVDAIRK